MSKKVYWNNDDYIGTENIDGKRYNLYNGTLAKSKNSFTCQTDKITTIDGKPTYICSFAEVQYVKFETMIFNITRNIITLNNEIHEYKQNPSDDSIKQTINNIRNDIQTLISNLEDEINLEIYKHDSFNSAKNRINEFIKLLKNNEDIYK